MDEDFKVQLKAKSNFLVVDEFAALRKTMDKKNLMKMNDSLKRID